MEYLLTCLLFCLVLIGFLMFFWTPVVRMNARTEFRERRFYLTEVGVVVARRREPLCLRCCGSNSATVSIPYTSIMDVSMTQSFFLRWFGLFAVHIETAGGGVMVNGLRPISDPYMVGLANPQLLKRLILYAGDISRSGCLPTREQMVQVAEAEAADVGGIMDATRKAGRAGPNATMGGATGVIQGQKGRGVQNDRAVAAQLASANDTLRSIAVLLDERE